MTSTCLGGYMEMIPVAATAYLAHIRRVRSKIDKTLTFEKLAATLQTSDSQVQRILAGEQDTRGANWFRIAEVIGASKVYLALLLAQPDAKKEVGQKTAEWWLALSPEQQQMYEALLATDDGREKLLRAAVDLLGTLKPGQ